jgi:hypothetical protein
VIRKGFLKLRPGAGRWKVDTNLRITLGGLHKQMHSITVILAFPVPFGAEDCESSKGAAGSGANEVDSLISRRSMRGRGWWPTRW